jgi:hypothetical protein
MAFDKADLKIAVFESLGARFDDMQEGADRELYRSQGAALGIKTATEQIVGLIALVKSDLDEGKLDLEESKTVITYLTRGVQQLNDMLDAARKSSLIHTGRKQGFLEAVQQIRKEHDVEEAKKARKAAEAEEDREVQAPEKAPPPPDLPVPKRKRLRTKRTNGANA